MRVIRFIKALWKYILYGERVSVETYAKRIDECSYCECLNEDNWTCKKCGCYVKKKARWSTEKCPEDRW